MSAESEVEQAISRHHGRPGALLPILHDVQSAVGHVPREAVPTIAHALNLSRAEVHGVVSFYHDFRETAPGRWVLKICRAESCQAVGAEALVAKAREILGIDFHQTTEDGAITLEPVYCLGNCALSPALTVGEDVRGKVTERDLADLIAELRRTP